MIVVSRVFAGIVAFERGIIGLLISFAGVIFLRTISGVDVGAVDRFANARRVPRNNRLFTKRVVEDGIDDGIIGSICIGRVVVISAGFVYTIAVAAASVCV